MPESYRPMDLDLEIRFPSEGGLVPRRSEQRCTRRRAAADSGPALPERCLTPRSRSPGSEWAWAAVGRRPNRSSLQIKNAKKL